MAQYFEHEQSELAASMYAQGVRYRSPQSAFEGKRICDTPEGINGVVAGQGPGKVTDHPIGHGLRWVGWART